VNHPDPHRLTGANRPRPHRRLGPVRLALTALSAVAFALALPSPASAQPAVWATSPEDGAALDGAPGEIAVTFSAPLDGTSSTVTLTGPDQAPVELDRPEISDTVLIQPMRYTVPGDYTVTVNAVFEDGQNLDSSFTFSVESIPDMLAAGEADPGEAAVSDAADADEPAPSLAIVIGAAVLAALVVGGGLVMVRRRTRGQGGDR
jgi:methionine-rich copper-binding protein CopC